MTGMPGMSSREAATGDSVSAAMGGTMDESAHMRMTSLAPSAKGDSERAATIVATLRQALEPYMDYHRALADGYHIFAPRVPQRVYHFSSPRRGVLSAVFFDPSRPSSLLYERTGNSGSRLVGAMYTAPRRAPLAALNARVPLSVPNGTFTRTCACRAVIRRESTACAARTAARSSASMAPLQPRPPALRPAVASFPQVFGWNGARVSVCDRSRPDMGRVGATQCVALRGGRPAPERWAA